MQQSFKNCKLRRKKITENSRKLLIILLWNITRISIKLWSNIEYWWRVKLLKLSNSEEKLRGCKRTIEKSSNRLKMTLYLKSKTLMTRINKIRLRFKTCRSSQRLSYNSQGTNWLIWTQTSKSSWETSKIRRRNSTTKQRPLKIWDLRSLSKLLRLRKETWTLVREKRRFISWRKRPKSLKSLNLC